MATTAPRPITFYIVNGKTYGTDGTHVQEVIA